MKINQINQIAKVYGPSSVKKVTSKDIEMKAKDNLNISETAKYFQLAYKAAKDAPDIREKKVENIKARIDTGTYNISAEEVAQKMIPGIFDKQI
ncbi:MAG TPA: flagellar biosynthesis anti-sigma factor FlgM, partial [Epulopiscium sp.]|nr:flagellar biosynthesis anti-sigma factor FlgM [Candidatus Epulonipiscium sp.]